MVTISEWETNRMNLGTDRTAVTQVSAHYMEIFPVGVLSGMEILSFLFPPQTVLAQGALAWTL